MSSDQYFKPKLKDFYDECIFYLKVPGDKSSTEPVYAIQHFHATRMNFHLVVKQHGDSYELNDDVFMRYLDGDQIEAFGFTRINNPPWDYSISMNTPEIEWFATGAWFISFSAKYKMIGIFQYDVKNRGQFLHVSCECRDINRFAKLVEWVIVSYEKRKTEDALINEQQNQITYGKEESR